MLWDSGKLPVCGEWRSDGPELPIEFARIAADGRLTLIIHPPAPPIRTYWAPLAVSSLEEAITVLGHREICEPRYIGRWPASRGGVAVAADAVEMVAVWARRRDLVGAVWTDLPSQFEERAEEVWTVEAGARYLAGLSGTTRQRAEEYVRRAPSQTRTPLRRLAEERLGWHPRRSSGSALV